MQQFLENEYNLIAFSEWSVLLFALSIGLIWLGSGYCFLAVRGGWLRVKYCILLGFLLAAISLTMRQIVVLAKENKVVKGHNNKANQNPTHERNEYIPFNGNLAGVLSGIP